MTNIENIDDIVNELLALFDDESIMSQIENILIHSELYKLSLLNLSYIPLPSAVENCQEDEKNNENQNNEYQNNEYQNNEYQNNEYENNEYENNEYENNAWQNNEYENNAYQNNECQSNDCQNNETNTRPNQDEDKKVFPRPKGYNCMYCPKEFYNETAIRRHHLNHAKDQLRCPRCRMPSYTFGTLRRHYIYYHYIHRKRYICRMPLME